MREREPLMEIDLSFPKVGGQNKIREMYDVDTVASDMLLMITTDRISAFDVIMKSGIPYKGEVLNRISAYWFRKTRHICQNHMVADNFSNFPDALQKELMPYKEVLEGRVMLVQKADVIPCECIVRSHLLGSAWKSYQEIGEICGIELPEGLEQGDELPAPIFTPSTKAEYGQHDQNISYSEMAGKIGWEIASDLQMFSLSIFRYISPRLSQRNIKIYDAKFEFGFVDDGDGNTQIMLIDELCTPDCMRVSSGNDKDILRNWLRSVNCEGTSIVLPGLIIKRLRNAYIRTCRKITNPA